MCPFYPLGGSVAFKCVWCEPAACHSFKWQFFKFLTFQLRYICCTAVMQWGFRTCPNKRGGTRLAGAVSGDGGDCEVVAPPTCRPREDAVGTSRHAVLDLSLKGKQEKHYPPKVLNVLLNLSGYDGNILVKWSSLWCVMIGNEQSINLPVSIA